MKSNLAAATTRGVLPHHIEIKLRDISQLFNTMDPSPFVDKDLDEDAEEFIVSWAREFPVREPIVLTVQLSEGDPVQMPDEMIEKAIHNYFPYRANLSFMDLRRLLREGRTSLLIGLTFLAVCLSIASLLNGFREKTLGAIGQEGLTIAGWVAMWRPLEIHLYDWWPVLRRCRIYEKLARMKIEIHRLGK